jgi:thiamine-monophosphate kinase
VGAVLALDRLPLSSAVRAALGPEGALRGGEDYELLLAVPPGRARAFERACARVGPEVTRIGVLTRERGLRLAGAEGGAEGQAGEAGDTGRRLRTPPPGFDHFARSGRRGRPDD